MKEETPPILIVEDNDDHAELIKRSLNRNQVANPVEHREDGESALAYLRELATGPAGGLPCLILLDVQLPQISGLDLLEKIKVDERFASIPAVMLSSSRADSDVERAYAAGANSYLVKPMDFAAFDRLMTDLGRYWLSWNVRPHR